MNDSIMSYETVSLDEQNGELVILDQTKLPGEINFLRLKDPKEIWEAIYLLKVRGAPAIGIAAGFGIYLAAKSIDTENYETFLSQFHEVKDYLNSSRP
ncbi:MAG: hypothetical protein IJR35_03865, partial [Synergistaceae bacterium]|nr:hypothetical protein [Synergistaceae bacterium]